MEAMLVDIYVICLYRLVPIFLIITLIAGVLKYLHSRIVGAGAGTSGDTSLHPVGRGLSFVFKEGLHEVVILLTISLVLYTVIFAWSIKARKRMPTEFEYWQAAMEHDLHDDTPISATTNLLGASREEIDSVFGDVDRKSGLMEMYDGVTASGNNYCVKIVYLPIANRAIWVETEREIG